MIKKILFGLLIISSVSIFGQELPQVVPPTPEAAALGKFIDIPVSHNTGVPQVGVPLCAISESGISIPISLSYHASGIRVDEMASRVGLGWSISGQGSITRSVRGIPDDAPDGYLRPHVTVQEFLEKYESILPGETLTGDVQDYFNLALASEIDFESDIYYFNLPGGGSGKFYFDKDGKIITMPYNQDIQIKPIKDANGFYITRWEVTLANGLKYFLGQSEDGQREAVDRSTSNSYTNQAVPDPPIKMTNYISAWHVLDIETPYHNTVTYQYEPVLTTFVNFGGANKFLWNQGPCDPTNTITYVETFARTNRVTQISGRKNTIEFEYGQNRLDLKNDAALTRVRQLNHLSEEIKAYELQYDYFTSGVLHANPATQGDMDQRTKRLYLKEVTQVAGTLSDQTYHFEYDTTHILPDRFSYATDFWGYYNGKINTTSIPSVEYLYSGILFDRPGADRKVDTEYTKACSLKKIIYPTGGSTTYDFEGHMVYGGGNQFFAATRFTPAPIVSGNTENQTAEFINIDFSVNSGPDSFNFPVGGLVDYTMRMSQNGANIPLCTNNGLDCPSVRILDADGNTISTLTKNQGTLPLGNGNYTLQLYNAPSIDTAEIDVVVHLSGRKLLDPASPNAAFGGLRIKEITLRETDGSQILKKKYSYQRFDTPELSSGLALNPPTFLWVDLPYCPGSIEGISMQASSSPIFPMNNQGSYNVGYYQVTESFEGNKSGKTEYTFFTAAAGEGVQNNIFVPGSYPNTPIQDLSHRRGVLRKQVDYRRTHNKSFLPIQEVNHIYHLGNSNGEVNTDKNLRFGAVGGFKNFQTYTNFSERYYLKESTQKSYFYEGNTLLDEVTQKTTYGYNSYPVHNQPTHTTTSSGEKTYSTHTKYSKDLANIVGLTHEQYNDIAKLNAPEVHRIATPIEVIQYEGDQKLSTQRTVFKEWEAGMVLPEMILISKSSNTLEPLVNYHRYDSFGNPLEVSQSDGPHIIYIWGYSDQYPIAKISNATYSGMPAAVTTLINQIKTTSNTENSITAENAMRAKFKTLRDHVYFEDAQITCYTYDPMVGVTSVTDPKGYTMTYHYDRFNRLEKVKDQEGNILSENEYHYKNN